MNTQVLIVDDEPLIRSTLERAFKGQGWTPTAASSMKEAFDACSGNRFDVAVLDLKLGDGDGLRLVERLHTDSPDTKTIIITAHGSVETAVAAMRGGAFDFVKKPFELEELLTCAQNALRTGQLERRLSYHDQRQRMRLEEDWISCQSLAMRKLEQEIAAAAPQPVRVLLVTGETGSGKALVARRLHFLSTRAQGPFVELNAAAVPDNLVESELFGYERGAFSDAKQRKLGLVEVADGGTLFLDEIGDLGPAVQSKLLTFLDSFSFRRLGGTGARTVDVRVVAATNRNLPDLIKSGTFRADLFYRLSAITLAVPALTTRKEDIGPLARHFLGLDALRFAKRFRALSPDAEQLLCAWHWPGNVRELKGVIERAVLMNDGETLDPDHLPTEMIRFALDPVPAAAKGFANHIPTLSEIELEYMRAVVKLVDGNKVRAAEHLGITRQTLAKRLGEAE